MIDAIFKANKILNIEGAINKIIDILKSKTTYGDLINICQKILPKNYLTKIKTLFDEKIITFSNCYSEKIEEDIELKKILIDLSNINNINI